MNQATAWAAGERRGARGEDAIERILHAVRTHLGMDVAFLSEFAMDDLVMRYVDGPANGPIRVGDAFDPDESYCLRIADGRLPELIPDTNLEPVAAALACTRAIPVGAHLSVPVRLRDGRVFGTFCCFSFQADASLNARDLATLKAFAELAAAEVQERVDRAAARVAKVARIDEMVERERFGIVYQPIVELASDRLVGVESLARFPGHGETSAWFADAHEVGLGQALELAAARVALSALTYLPPELFVSINLSPATLATPEFAALRRSIAPGRVQFELWGGGERVLPRPEHLRLAIDRVGVGSLRGIAEYRPDTIKIDRELVRGIDGDPAHRALVAALVALAGSIDSDVAASGIETAAELATLLALGVRYGQGYHVGEPMPIAGLCQYLARRGVQFETAITHRARA